MYRHCPGWELPQETVKIFTMIKFAIYISVCVCVCVSVRVCVGVCVRACLRAYRSLSL